VFIADTHVHELPDPACMVEIAKGAARQARMLGQEPRVAFVSFSNFGQPDREKARPMRDAVTLLDGQKAEFEYEGEMAPDVALDYEAITAAGGLLGHGGIVVFDESVDMAVQARFAMEFCAAESCGKCTPCRVGSTRGVELIDRISAGTRRDANHQQLLELCDVLEHGSLCALGGLTPYPVRSALRLFPTDFGLVTEETA
jgi:hypothetical protein